MFSACHPDEFNLERHLVPFLQENPFFAEVSRHIRKVVTLDERCPTAAMAYEAKQEEFTLFANAKFFDDLSDLEVKGVLRHELYHFVLGHLTFRRRRPPRRWNIATDLAINSMIMLRSGEAKGTDSRNKVQRHLPPCALIPGQWPVKPDGRPLTKEEQAASKLGALIASFKPEESSEYYFDRISELAEKEKKRQKGKGESGEGDDDYVFGPGSGDDWIDSMDEHDMWDDVPEEARDLVEARIKDILDKAVQHADSRPHGWGDIPAYLQKDIRTYLAGEIDWRSVLRNWVGTIYRCGRKTSLKRINRRYPYVHPGVIKDRVPHLLIAIDQSGSVIDEWLIQFFSELGSLNRRVDFSVLPFDCTANVDEIKVWKKGSPPPPKRTRSGGTNFDAPTKIFNDPKNKGRWDGLMIMTDGGAGKPGPCRGKRAWVLAKGTQLMFPSDEIQIFLSQPPKGGKTIR